MRWYFNKTEKTSDNPTESNGRDWEREICISVEEGTAMNDNGDDDDDDDCDEKSAKRDSEL